MAKSVHPVRKVTREGPACRAREDPHARSSKAGRRGGGREPRGRREAERKRGGRRRGGEMEAGRTHSSTQLCPADAAPRAFGCQRARRTAARSSSALHSAHLSRAPADGERDVMVRDEGGEPISARAYPSRFRVTPPVTRFCSTRFRPGKRPPPAQAAAAGSVDVRVATRVVRAGVRFERPAVV